MINFENLDKFIFPGVGKYGVPQIEPVKTYPQGEFIPINYHYTAKDTRSKIVHFFVDDYQFTRYWNAPDKYIQRLSEFAAVCAPDFSTYTDMPLAMQIYNHYRKHWLAASTAGRNTPRSTLTPPARITQTSQKPAVLVMCRASYPRPSAPS